MSEEQTVIDNETDPAIPMISSVGVVINHPVHGKLTRLASTPDDTVELYRDEYSLLYFYYNNLLRFHINPQFWMQAELSVVQFNEVAQILSAGQPVLSVPLKTNLVLQEDIFPSVIDEIL